MKILSPAEVFWKLEDFEDGEYFYVKGNLDTTKPSNGAFPLREVGQTPLYLRIQEGSLKQSFVRSKNTFGNRIFVAEVLVERDGDIPYLTMVDFGFYGEEEFETSPYKAGGVESSRGDKIFLDGILGETDGKFFLNQGMVNYSLRSGATELPVFPHEKTWIDKVRVYGILEGNSGIIVDAVKQDDLGYFSIQGRTEIGALSLVGPEGGELALAVDEGSLSVKDGEDS